MSIIDNLVTDRSQADVDSLRALLARGAANWTAEELSEFNLARSKGAYNYTDLNRVTEAMDYLNDRLVGYGYQTGYQRVEVPHQQQHVSPLPDGYTQLAWIESSGTQYVDTGVQVGPNTFPGLRVEADALIVFQPGIWAVSGCGNGDPTFYIGVSAGEQFAYGNGTADVQTGITYVGERHMFDLDVPGSSYTVPGYVSLQEISFSVPSNSRNFLISAYNTPNSGAMCHAERIYRYTIQQNGEVVRNFIPCRTGDGKIGLYDTVNGQFYGSSGTGEFIAGAEIGFEDITPTMTSDTTPEGYAASASSRADATRTAWHVFDKISAPGELVGKWHSGAGMPQWIMLQFPEAVSVSRFSITNAQDDGTYHYTGITTFSLQGSNDGSQFDTLGEYTNQTGYGVTTSFDVESPAPYLYYRIYITGSSFVWSGTTYAVIDEITFYEGEPVRPEQMDPYTWYESDIPTVSLMTAYLSNVEAIRSTLEVLATTPETPESMEALTWVEANNIEQILVDVETVINRVVNAMARSNSFTFWSGNLPFPTAESNLGRNWAELDAMDTTWANWQVATWYFLLYGNLEAEGEVI